MVSSRRGNKKPLLHEPEGRTPEGSEYFSLNKRTVGRRSACAGRFSMDMDAYAAKYGSNAVKKTLTIPAWLNTFVEQNGISCSKVLQDALSKMAQAR